jgi:hypothetical protein
MFVVAEDFVGAAGIQDRKLVDAAKNFFELARENVSSTLLLEPIESFFEGFLDGAGQGLPGLLGDFAG